MRWKALKTSEKIGLLGLIVAIVGVLVPTIGLIPSFHDMSASGRVSTSPSPTRTAATAAVPTADAGAPAVKINKIDHPVHDGQSMVTATPPAEKDVRPLIHKLKNREVTSVLRPLGAVDAESTTMAVRMEGNSTRPVRITGMRAVSRCSAPLRGGLFFNPNAGEQANPQLGFDLDRPDPVARERGTDDRGFPVVGEPYFVRHEYDLALGETATFLVTATTRLHYCEFHLVLDLLVDGTPRTQDVYEDGRPFRVSAGLGDRVEGGEIDYDYSRYAMALLSPIVPPYPDPPAERTWHLAR